MQASAPSVGVHLPASAPPNRCSPRNPNRIFIRFIPPIQIRYSITTTLIATSYHLLTTNNVPTFAQHRTLQETKKFTQNSPPVLHLLSLNSGDDPESDDRSKPQNWEQDPGSTQKPRGKAPPRVQKRRGISPSMWWADFKAGFGQIVNFEGIVCSAEVFFRHPQLALPHVRVQDVGYIDWGELKRRGYKGVVFDKDNTITAPYSLKLWPPIAPSIERCKYVFGQNIAVFSNSAGLVEYDQNGAKAKALEWSVGIKVIKHGRSPETLHKGVKKPAGHAEEIKQHFGCDSSHLIMVGDRPFTDIVYGNRNEFFTILVEPLSLAEEPFIVRQVRKLETALVNRWLSNGLKPANHHLLPDSSLCVKDPNSQ